MGLARMVLDQKEFYNGHGQMEISELSIKRVKKLLIKLEKLTPGRENFILELWSDGSGSISETRISGGNKLWLGIDKITGLD